MWGVDANYSIISCKRSFHCYLISENQKNRDKSVHIVESIVISNRWLEYEKTDEIRFVKIWEIVTECSFAHCANAESPTDKSLDRIVIDANWEHSANAKSPIDVTLVGIVIERKLEQ